MMYRRHTRQEGAILLSIILVLIVSSGYVLLTKMNTVARNRVVNERTMNALAQAKEALIAHAVTYYDLNPNPPPGEFGYLPCPDRTAAGTEGNQDPNCGVTNVNSLGRLPWKSLGIPVLRDASGECLWYAVTGEYKIGVTKNAFLNEDSNGAFNIFGTDGAVLAGNGPADRAIAVVIAPGRVLQNQVRTTNPADPNVRICGGNIVAANYLEARGAIDNAAIPAGGAYALDTFIAATDQTAVSPDDANADVNDVMVFITANELLNRIRSRSDFDDKLYDDAAAIDSLTETLARCVREYGLSHANNFNYSLPWPAPVDLANNYRNDAAYDDVTNASNILSGRLPDIVDDSRTTIDPAGRTNLITQCTSFNAGAPGGPERLELWRNWKDHFFYAVAETYQPLNNGAVTMFCGNGARCITINNNFGPPDTSGGRDYAAVVMFSNNPLSSVPQIRTVNPPDAADTKANIANYLEGANNTVTYMDGAGDSTKRFDHLAASGVFNDILYCINDHDGDATDFTVTLCPTTP